MAFFLKAMEITKELDRIVVLRKKKHPFDKLDFLPGPKFNFAK